MSASESKARQPNRARGPLESCSRGAVGHPLQVLWMNTVLRTLWPYYNAAIGQQVLEQATPIIAEQLKPVRITRPEQEMHDAHWLGLACA